jgi:dimethylsulfide dehydrogenase subunit beta/complex iron-sulfur molybdoenzyme family reductase subunit beta
VSLRPSNLEEAPGPLPYLEGLFGPPVKAALDSLGREMAKRRRGEASKLTELLIGYTTRDRFRL